MPRGSIPDHLKHRPEEVKRNAERFDRLCEITEEVSFPIVRDALIEETKATSAEALTEEARLALEALLHEAQLLDEPDNKETLDKLRESLGDAARLPVDEEECQSHTRDVAQVLAGTWVELLRQDLLKHDILMMSEELLPTWQHTSIPQYTTGHKSDSERSQTLRALIDALSPLALDETRILNLLSTLHDVLFDRPCRIDLPFEMALVGGPENPIIAMKANFYHKISAERDKNPLSFGLSKPWMKPRSERSKSTVPKPKGIAHLQNPLAESDLAALTAAALRYLPELAIPSVE
jgi:hypothetical protein